MARGPAARGRARGGEVVPPLRPSAARLAATAAALALAAALGAYPLAYAGKLAPLAGVFGLLGIALVGVALAGAPRVVPWALAALAVDYGLVDLARDVPLVAAAFEGAGLLLVAELTYAARELARSPDEHPLRRLGWLLVLAACALAVAFLPLAAADVSPPTGLPAELLALLASILLLVPPALLLRRSSRPFHRRG
jgi:hypothetical protein